MWLAAKIEPADDVVDPRPLGVLADVVDDLVHRAHHEGGVVDVRLVQEPDRIAVEVVDTGPGIPQDLLPRVFDRFFRVPGNGTVFISVGQMDSVTPGLTFEVYDKHRGLPKLTSPTLDLRRFERRDGEVLLRRDVLGHRLIDVPSAHLTRAADLELRQQWTPGGREEWVLAGVDTHRCP